MLISLLERRMTGSLVVQDPSGRKSAFSVQNGAIVKAKTPEPVVRLGDLLIELHALEPKTLDRSLRHAKQAQIPIGQSLLRLNAVAEPILDAALAEQLSRRVVWACALPADSRYGFYGGVDFLSAWGAGPVQADPLALIWRCARDHADPARVASVLQRLGPRPVRLHSDARLDRFHFGWDDVAALERLKSELVPVQELLDAPRAEPETLERMVYVLALTRHLDLGDSHPPAGVGGSSTRPSRLRSGIALSGQGHPSPEIREAPNSAMPSIAPHTVRPIGPASISPRPRNSSASGAPPGSSVRPTVSVSPPQPPSRSTPPSRPQSSLPPSSRASTLPNGAAGESAPPSSAFSQPPRQRRGWTGRQPNTGPPSSTRTSVAPASAKPDPLEWRLNAKVAQAERNDLYSLLEVDKNAAPGTIQAAYVKLAKVWHPDKLPPGMLHRKDDAARLFSKLSEGRRVLCDTELRQTYDHELETGESEEATVTRVVEAASEFRKAELLAKRNDYAAALRHAEAAYKADDEQPEYAALYAFVVLQSAPDLEQKRIDELAEIVDKAAKADKENLRIRLYRGYVFKRAGRELEAMRDFKYVARNDRHNVDALRELRLYHLRKEREEKSGGLFGGLFGGSRPSTAPKSRR
jgi:curved DNA-binding protein CbpA